MKALYTFGLVIGCLDIVGAILLIIVGSYFIWACENATSYRRNIDLERSIGPPKIVGSNSRKLYLLLLCVWIVITLLMITGILMQEPSLMIFWFVWCSGGLVFDMIIIVWWVIEMLAGDVIEASTNILISLITMVIETGFIIIIYNIYEDLKREQNKT